MVHTRAEVRTDNPARYAKQLSSHLGRRCAVEEDHEGTRITLPGERGSGSCLLRCTDGLLALEVEAESAEVLDVVHDVVGRHLERFGQRDGLAVEWLPGAA
ncbi:hypothetical protein FHX42_003378 [Saccharopolyspora lacisalsi]|uniref:DUF2218 domain-containing protein n=1 Tax=Halosaccharopolyspora lacisalsi TaxID=1000566 RepID=A0A839DVL2_9PSEU|nr:DUF2218 domain-containing protein [Halosaccharopolyspora lacisalsi]MBA8826012.1 hypothetical protein [Halosaccharopolyspora lacisalsi]